MGVGARQSRARAVDTDDLGRTAGQRRHRKAARIAEAVQHRLAAELAHRVGKLLAVVALVEVIAGLVAFGDVQRQLPLMLVDRQLGRPIAAQPAGLFGQALELAHLRVRALVELAQAGRRQQQVGDHRFPALGAGGEELRDQGVGVAVDDQAWQAIGLGMDQTHAIRRNRQPGAHRQGGLDALRKKARVDALRFVKAPGPHAEDRLRAVSTPAEELAFG